MKRRVAVTGIGPVTSVGIGKEEFFKSILERKLKVSEIPEDYIRKYPFKSRYYVPAPKMSFDEYGIPAPVEIATGEAAKLAVVGAKLALEDAGFKIVECGKYFSTDADEGCDIIMGIGMNSLRTAFNSYVSHIFEGKKDEAEKYGIHARYNRMVIPMLMPNSTSSWISILFGIKGSNHTINASCASGTCAIGEAYLRIRNGLCITAVTGGVESLEEKYGAIMRGFDMLSTLTMSSDGNPMPFSNKRSGFLFNEGAGCVLILEELENAVKRGAQIYAEICGYECNSDAYNIVQMDESGRQIVQLLSKLVDGRKIDYLNAHGTGTILNDSVEADVIKRVFGDKDRQPLINSTKGLIGHSIGASGAIEAAVAALSISRSVVHGSIIDDPMDNLNLVMESVLAKIDYALSASYGFGGHNAAILFKRYEGEDG
jgi:3-oxoacyl-[acyl-carrier-protein] synthase II